MEAYLRVVRFLWLRGYRHFAVFVACVACALVFLLSCYGRYSHCAARSLSLLANVCPNKTYLVLPTEQLAQ